MKKRSGMVLVSDIGTFLMLKHVQKLLIGNDLSSVDVKGLDHLRWVALKPFSILKPVTSQSTFFLKSSRLNTPSLLQTVTVKRKRLMHISTVLTLTTTLNQMTVSKMSLT
jgi:hypothetical protein